MYTIPIETEMEVFARVYGKDTGLEILPGPVCCTTGKKIYMIPISDSADPWQRFMYEIIVYHESGHVVKTDFALTTTDPVLHGIHNSLEDVFVEHHMEETYKGMRRKWVEFLQKFVKDPRAKINNNIGPVEWLKGLLYYRARELQLGITLDITPPPAVEKLFKARLAKYVPEVAAITSTAESMTIAKRVYENLKDLIEEQKQKQEQKKKEKQKNQKKDSQTSAPGGGDSEEQDPDDSEDQDPPEDGEDQDPVSKSKDSSDSEDPSDKDVQKLINDLADQIESGNVDTDGVSEELKDQFKDYADSCGVLRKAPGLKENINQQYVNYPREASAYETQGRSLAGYDLNKLRSLFISERAPVWVSNVESGRLDIHQLHRLKTGGAKTIFRKKTEGVYEDSAVSMVLDVSGSMKGNKYPLAAGIATAMGSELERLRIPFEALSFDSDCDCTTDPLVRTQPCNIYIIKGFEESHRKTLGRFAWHGGHGTNELPAIELAAQHLAMRRETKKVLFILTDGKTSVGGGLEPAIRRAMKEYIQRISRAGIRVVGFSIDCDSLEGYCPDHISVSSSNPSEFSQNFFKKLSKYLL